MIKRFGILSLIVAATLTWAACGTSVKFKSKSTLHMEEVPLRGTLTKPNGNGPFPAVVLMHACAGVDQRQINWASRLKGWGYVSLIVDSFGPRVVFNVCDGAGSGAASPDQRAGDAHGAKDYLSGLPFVDPLRIAVMGWSHGANSVLMSLLQNEENPFEAAIAFYPFCYFPLKNVDAPLLILIGELDDWTPANACASLMPSQGESTYEVIVKIYPKAYHCFDDTRRTRTSLGHHLEYNPKATADAIIQVREFLAKHLK